MPLPALREELDLFEGPRMPDGQPSYTLHDPVRNQFFQLDWLSFEIISRWHLDAFEPIAAAIARETTLHPEPEDVEALAIFLQENQLLRPPAGDGAAAMAAKLARLKGNRWSWLLHHYLFFRIPLVRPDRWLDRWVGAVEPLYSRAFLHLTLAALVLGLSLVLRDWQQFTNTLVDHFSWQGLAGFALALTLVKILHELGHAFTAKRYGCRVPAMGVAFLVLWPVAYTDTNEVWQLNVRGQRLAVAAAGVATELIIAVWATLAWTLLPPGLAKSTAFLLATTTWIATVAINTSPFMRFDGYFLLSDWLDIPNLHARAFALARWDLRERLFGLGEAPPETFSRRRTAGLIVFAYATWLYRIALFLGIAVLVYHFFIKALGILLFIVEIGWFVLLPVVREVKLWPALIAAQHPEPFRSHDLGAYLARRPRLRLTAALALLLLVLVVVPWPTRLSASGSLRPAEIYPLHAPAAAQIGKLPAADGAAVAAGATLLELASPELNLRWRRAQSRLERVRWQTANAGVEAEQRQQMQVLQQAQITAAAELAGVETEIDLFAPKAPFDGVLYLDPELEPGVWVGERERLGMLVKPGAWQVQAYFDEDDVRRVRMGDSGRFFADGLEGPALTVHVSGIEHDAARVLHHGELASEFGGSVLTRERRGQLVPERAVYRVTLSVEGDPGRLDRHSWRGKVVIRGEWEPPGMVFVRSAMALVWREVGF
ncbi:site-2 protease family protein [Massilia glaciei]|uniref:site-2 protease family protein n=1 Tax=Massilia glaciei TaxID=1524097 RepID=UPI0015E80A87|nr:site-2 protease family protein [Massilia glaciei]